MIVSNEKYLLVKLVHTTSTSCWMLKRQSDMKLPDFDEIKNMFRNVYHLVVHCLHGFKCKTASSLYSVACE